MIREVMVGDVLIGGESEITVQSMTNTDTKDIESTVNQIKMLEEAGCDIVRVAAMDLESAKCLKDIKSKISIPLVADIHFDYRIALECVKQGADKIRINPGNIGDMERIKKVVDACRERNVPIRVGVNAGSLDRKVIEMYDGVNVKSVFESVKERIKQIEDCDYDNIVVSIKASDIQLNNSANRYFRERYDYPLHVGITESGQGIDGIVKSSIGLSMLLKDDIGETMRVSLTDNPIKEIETAYAILRTLHKRKGMIEFISCPTCGRTKVDLITVTEKIKNGLKGVKKDIKVAIMGCAVNGPGEAREADIGIAGGKGMFLVFKKGEIIKKVKEEDVVECLLKEIKRM